MEDGVIVNSLDSERYVTVFKRYKGKVNTGCFFNEVNMMINH